MLEAFTLVNIVLNAIEIQSWGARCLAIFKLGLDTNAVWS